MIVRLVESSCFRLLTHTSKPGANVPLEMGLEKHLWLPGEVVIETNQQDLYGILYEQADFNEVRNLIRERMINLLLGTIDECALLCMTANFSYNYG